MSNRESKEPQDYLIEITDFKFDYMFGLSDTKYDAEPYAEYCQPKIKGNLLHPNIDGVGSTQITLITDRRIDETFTSHKIAQQYKPVVVGGVERQDEMLVGQISMPFSAINMITTSLIANKVRYLSLHGKKLKYRRAKIQSYSFAYEYEPDDYI